MGFFIIFLIIYFVILELNPEDFMRKIINLPSIIYNIALSTNFLNLTDIKF